MDEANANERRWFRHGAIDALHLATVVAALAVIVATAWWFDALPWPLLVVALALGLPLSVTTIQSSQHYHVHTPFFVARRLNAAWHVVLSALFGFPSTGYVRGHKLHHRYTVSYTTYRLYDAVFPTTARGWLQSIGVVYLDGLRLSFVILSLKLLRSPLVPSSPTGRASRATDFADLDDYVERLVAWTVEDAGANRGFQRQLLVESLAITGFRVALLVVSWKFFVAFYLPAQWIHARFAAMYEHATHFGGVDGATGRDAASSYGWLYNALSFNSGYHQEHHLSPALHWTRLPSARAKLPAEDERRVVPYGLMLNALVPLAEPPASASASSMPEPS